MKFDLIELLPKMRSGKGISRMKLRAKLALSYAAVMTAGGGVLAVIIVGFMFAIPAGYVRTLDPGDVLLRQGGEQISIFSDESDVSDSIQVNALPYVLQTMSWGIVLGLVLLAFIGAVVGWVVSGRMLRPLKAVNAAAMLAAQGSLDHRIGFEGPQDEIHDLCKTFDNMLEKLQKSFEAQERFSANVSHELRTPLATTQVLIDVALADPETDVEQFRTMALKIRQMNDRNAKTVTSLLDLADVSGASLVYEPVDVNQLLRQCSLSVEDQAQEQDVLVENLAEGRDTVVITAGKTLLFQGVTNLLRNGIFYNYPGGRVQLDWRCEDDLLEIIVTNTGEIVDESVLDSLCEPFVRGRARVQSAGNPKGNGLGLALSLCIAEAYGGSLELEANSTGGLRVCMKLLKDTV